MAIRLQTIGHPNGRRHPALLLRLNEEVQGGLAEAAGPRDRVVKRAPPVAGICGTSADASDGAMKWFAGYRTLH